MTTNNKMKCYVCYEYGIDALCTIPQKVFWYRKDAEAWVEEGKETVKRIDSSGREYEIDLVNYRDYVEIEIE